MHEHTAMAAGRNGQRARNLRNHSFQLGIRGSLAQPRPRLREKKIACVATDTGNCTTDCTTDSIKIAGRQYFNFCCPRCYLEPDIQVPLPPAYCIRYRRTPSDRSSSAGWRRSSLPRGAGPPRTLARREPWTAGSQKHCLSHQGPLARPWGCRPVR